MIIEKIVFVLRIILLLMLWRHPSSNIFIYFQLSMHFCCSTFFAYHVWHISCQGNGNAPHVVSEPVGEHGH